LIKYAVEEDEAEVKTAEAKPLALCPLCGEKLLPRETTNVLVCAKCGTKGFEAKQP
jgi:ribosomal protein L37AE/L43A